ncbi:MAG: hypothetical protein EPO07_15640 [Verrucomicrobia bacterium]|nr:MAG: hypothetical protein EPO07_15640 [Verrucomicrobiota bacterium]
MLAALVWVTASVSFAELSLVQFDVFPGYDQVTREGNWFPIVCEIKNNGPSFSGTVEVSNGTYGKDQTHRVTIELPTGTLKRITLPAFAAGRYAGVWNVRLADARGKTISEQTALRPRVQVGWETMLLGSLSRTPGGSPNFRPLNKSQAELQPTAARFQPSVFPDNPLLLEALDAIYLSAEVAGELRNEQVNALLGWLNAGGHLIVSLEQATDVNALPWLKEVLPFEPKESRLLQNHSQLQDWASGLAGSGNAGEASFSDLRPDPNFELKDMQALTGGVRDGRVLLKSGDVPLIVRGNRGLGRVTVLTFNPEREPFRSWKNSQSFWSKLAGVPASVYSGRENYNGYGQSIDSIFGAMIDSRQVRKLPTTWLLTLLLVYLLVIGPLDRWWLNRIGKPMLTWITFPGYVVVFSLLIYLIGYKLRAGETEFNELHLVDVLRNGDRAELRGRTYASLYSPANAKFTLASKQKTATFRGELMSVTGRADSDNSTVRQKGDSFEADVFVPVWTSQLFTSDWWQSVPMPWDVTVKPQGETLAVEVVNHSGKRATNLQLVVGDRIYPLGELGEGESKSAKFKRDEGTELSVFTRANSQRFFDIAQRRQYAFGETKRGQISDLPSSSIAVSFIRQAETGESYRSFQLPQGLDLSEFAGQGNALLLAWTADNAPVPALNQFAAKRGFHHTLWRVPIVLSPKS